jgi:heterodisulfide reductase subunit C
MDLQQDKFGFSLMKPRDISLDNATHLKVMADAASLEPTMMQCMQCGSCTASCTTSAAGTNMRKALLLWARGLTDEARNVTSACLFCGKCRFVCPRGVNGRHALTIIHSQDLKSSNYLI